MAQQHPREASGRREATSGRLRPAGQVLRTLPWIGILAIIGAVQASRAQPIDAGVFAVAILALVAGLAGIIPGGRPIRMPLGIAAGVAAVAVVPLVVLPRHGVELGLVMTVIGVAATVLAWLDRPGGRGPADRRTRTAIVAWTVVVVTACLLELVSFLVGRADAAAKVHHPAVSELLDPLLDTWWGRLGFAALWCALGVLLVTRGRRR